MASGTAVSRLAALGIVLPVPASPVANYVPYVITGNLIFISGQLCTVDGKIADQHKGKVGTSEGCVTQEEAYRAAEICGINILAQLTSSLCLRHSLTAPQAQHALGGNLERIKRVVRLGGFVNVTAGYTAIAPVMNGCSDFIVKVLGEKGRHARAAVGVFELPLGAVVEVDAVMEIETS